MSVPNQKVITIHKNLTPPFLQVSKADLYNAMRTLTHSGLVLYLYLIGNQDGYRLELSKAEIVDKLQLLSRASYYRAVEDLEANGYIVNGSFDGRSEEQRTLRNQIEKEIIKIRGQS